MPTNTPKTIGRSGDLALDVSNRVDLDGAADNTPVRIVTPTLKPHPPAPLRV